MNIWVPAQGCPITVITDGAKCFTGLLITELAKRSGIKMNTTSTYHPQSNGKIERQHRTMKAYLTIYCQRGDEWARKLPMLKFTLRNTVRDGEAYSPAFLMTGR